MRIPNPLPHYPRLQVTCETPAGDVVCSVTTRAREIEVPDNTTKAMIVAVKFVGRGGDVEHIGAPMFWIEEWGILDQASLATKLAIQREVEDVDKLRREKITLQKEIAARAKKKAAENKNADELKIEDKVEVTKE